MIQLSSNYGCDEYMNSYEYGIRFTHINGLL